MKILIAPDKFRGSLDADEVCDAIEKGVLLACAEAEVVKVALADGGEGTTEILTRNENGRFVTCAATDPLGRSIKAQYGLSGDEQTAFIEMSAASGLHLLKKEEYNPLTTSSVGTGHLIADALDKGVHTIVLGLGGSATSDAGTGMGHALGFRFLDEKGNQLEPNGLNLQNIRSIKEESVHPLLKKCRIIVACDVINPLYGPDGAAFVYGPQKGAAPEAVSLLDAGLRSIASVAGQHFKKNLDTMPGAGAAGGVGAGAVWFLNASLHEGIRIVMDRLGIPEKIKKMDLVITGEGKADQQTLSGKVVKGLGTLCHEANVPLAMICGTLLISPREAEAAGITYAASILNRPMDLPTAQKEAGERITETAYYLTKLFTFRQEYTIGSEAK